MTTPQDRSWYDSVDLDHPGTGDPRLELRWHMHELSEYYDCAGWLCDLGFLLWLSVEEGEQVLCGMGGGPSEEERAHLRALRERAKGWWEWFDPYTEPGPTFFSLETWEPLYRAWRQRIDP